MKTYNTDEVLKSKFGCWKPIREVEKKRSKKGTKRYFLCTCDCGVTKEVSLISLVTGDSERCRSCASKIAGKKRAIDYSNKKYGALKAIKPIENHNPGDDIVWEFICSCGNLCNYKARYVFGVTSAPHVACPLCEEKMSCEQKRGLLDLSKAYKHAKIACNLGSRSFDLTIEEYDSLTTNKPCTYCGKLDGRCGLDRINSDLDYNLSNCTPCCIICNRMKSNLSRIEFINHIKFIYNNLINEKS